VTNGAQSSSTHTECSTHIDFLTEPLTHALNSNEILVVQKDAQVFR
jgi:hypothetical protein